jgi:3-oxoacyl-[acyl-carrier protein] reductase
VARSLHDLGVNLGLASRSGDDLGLADTVALPADVRDPAALKKLADSTAERFGGIDILVINAGVGSYGPILDLPDDEMEEMIDVNVKGALYSVRAVLPYLLESDTADIVTVASEAGRRGAHSCLTVPADSAYYPVHRDRPPQALACRLIRFRFLSPHFQP